MTPAPFRSWVEISRSRLAANYRAVAGLVGDRITVAPVVKADAYGHGAIEVSRLLASEGARWLAVSSFDEGARLREAGIGLRILIMADLPWDKDLLSRFALTPVVHALDQLPLLEELSAGAGRLIDFHLKIDSGMARLGVRESAAQIRDVLDGLRFCRLEGLMTHLAAPADYTSPQTAGQQASFDAIAAGLASAGIRPAMVHMAATTAIAYGRRESWKTMVRPGHAIYGYVSPVRVAAPAQAPANLLAVKPALTWKAAILAVKEVPAGTRIGYGGMYVAPRAMRIGIAGAGYADGLPHRLSNRGRVIAGGNPAAILGAVSMDLTTVDLSNAAQLRPGDSVTLIGAEGSSSQDAKDLARQAGTISYGVLCGISPRVRRIWVD